MVIGSLSVDPVGSMVIASLSFEFGNLIAVALLSLEYGRHMEFDVATICNLNMATI